MHQIRRGHRLCANDRLFAQKIYLELADGRRVDKIKSYELT